MLAERIARLPAPSALREHLKTCAIMEILLTAKEHLRSYFYIPDFLPGVDLAWYDNGGGNDAYIAFAGSAAVIKGFDHESPVSPHAREPYSVAPGIYDDVPADLRALIEQFPSELEDVTFCTWFSPEARAWQCGNLTHAEDEDDGSDYLLGCVDRTREDHLDWVQGYHQPGTAMTHILERLQVPTRLSMDELRVLDPARDLSKWQSELEKLGVRCE